MEPAQKKIPEKSHPKGHLTFREHPAGSEAIFRKLQLWAGRNPRRQAIAMGAVRAGRVVLEVDNLIMQGSLTGKDLIIQYLIGNLGTGMPNAALNVGVNWGAIGTGVTTPAVGDTQLGAEVARSSALFFQDSGFDEATLQFFFPDGAILNQTYTEFGSFVNGTATANSGNMFNHALLSPSYVKTSGTDLTVELDVTLS
jgi:hypothetical protein